ncbi:MULTISPECIES: hypothetical protein [Pirellulaceae]|uniref:hypothetical protein n=1 Tax=Pirellulaceae TaxID=2691357 RepID=UPI0011B07B99|nr:MULTISPECIES: hypothetical protein [Pirellulaceae]
MAMIANSVKSFHKNMTQEYVGETIRFNVANGKIERLQRMQAFAACHRTRLLNPLYSLLTVCLMLNRFHSLPIRASQCLSKPTSFGEPNIKRPKMIDPAAIGVEKRCVPVA